MPAAAQDVAAAEELYNRGVADYRAGRYDAACQEIGASYRLDPLPGALFTLATCETHLGRIATAAAHYADYVQLVLRLPADQQAIQAERVRAAQAERAALVSDIPYLTITLGEGNAKGLTIRRDGAVLESTSLGRELPVDPGDHVVSAEGPDGAREEQHVVVGVREHKTVIVHLSTPAPAPAPPAASTPAAATTPANAHQGGRSTTPWVTLAAGVGFAGVGLGAVTGLLAMNEKSIVDQSCLGAACSARGKNAADTGRTEALVSTVSFGVGLGAFATLAILLLVDDHARPTGAPHATPTLGFSGNTLVVGAAF